MPKAPALEVHDEVFEDWKTTKKDQVKWAREVKDLHWSSDMASSHVAKREEADLRYLTDRKSVNVHIYAT